MITLVACAEMMVKAYMTSYKLPCIITRCDYLLHLRMDA